MKHTTKCAKVNHLNESFTVAHQSPFKSNSFGASHINIYVTFLAVCQLLLEVTIKTKIKAAQIPSTFPLNAHTNHCSQGGTHFTLRQISAQSLPKCI